MESQLIPAHGDDTEHVGATGNQVANFDSTIEPNHSGFVAEGSGEAITLNGDDNVTGVPVTVTQSPTVVKAELTEYAVTVKYTPIVCGILFMRVIFLDL